MCTGKVLEFGLSNSRVNAANIRRILVAMHTCKIAVYKCHDMLCDEDM